MWESISCKWSAYKERAELSHLSPRVYDWGSEECMLYLAMCSVNIEDVPDNDKIIRHPVLTARCIGFWKKIKTHLTTKKEKTCLELAWRSRTMFHAVWSQWATEEPAKLHYKIFLLTDDAEIPYNFNIYTEKITKAEKIKDIGASENIVGKLVSHLS